MKRVLIWGFIVSLIFMASDLCRASEFSQKDGVFTINVFDGWMVESKEEVGEVFQITPKEKEEGNLGMIIRLNIRLDLARGVRSGVATPPGVKEEDLLDYYFKQAVDFMNSGGVETPITLQKKILLDGRPAFRVDTIIDFRPRGGALIYRSDYECVTRDYLYGISIVSVTEDKKSEMEQMLNTIKIKR